MIGISSRVFFDSSAVMREMDQTTRRAFSRYGAFVRRRARSSIRKRKRASRPGQAPTSRTGLLRGRIFFSYDRVARSVVIGPTPLRGPAVVPGVLEYGGVELVTGRSGGRRVRRRVQYAARPYMGPAAAKEQANLPAIWAQAAR